MQIVFFLPKTALRLVVFIFQNRNSLSEIACDVLNSSLALSVVDCQLYFYILSREIEDFAQTCFNFNVVRRLDAAETACALKMIFEQKLLVDQVHSLFFDLISFLLLIINVFFILKVFHVANSDRLHDLLFVLFIKCKFLCLWHLGVNSHFFNLGLSHVLLDIVEKVMLINIVHNFFFVD